MRKLIWGERTPCPKGRGFSAHAEFGPESGEKHDIGKITEKTTEQHLPYTLEVSRKFISPENYDKVIKELSEKLHKKTIEIGFPTMKQSGRQSERQRWRAVRVAGGTEEAVEGMFSVRGLSVHGLVVDGIDGIHGMHVISGRGRAGWTSRTTRLRSWPSSA
jgi:hypothetical protein